MNHTYRLEYSEEQHWLRMEYGSYPAMSNNFVTLKDNCTDEEYEIIECFLYRNEITGPLLENKSKYTTVDVLRAFNEPNDLRKHLKAYNFSMQRSK